MTASTLRPQWALQHLREARRCLPQPRRSLVTTSPLPPPSLQGRARLTGSPLLPARTTTSSPPSTTTPPRSRAAAFHASGPPLRLFGGRRRRPGARDGEEAPGGAAQATDFSRLDVLGAVPAPSTSVDICSSDGFKLDSGVSVYHGRGVLLAGGEAFEWQPWGREMRLLNERGQWEVPGEAFALLELLWPRPDLLILGLGPVMRPLSPATRRHLGSLGLRVEVLDTRNAASQFNMLATERGVDDVAAALIPIGWREGIGANWG